MVQLVLDLDPSVHRGEGTDASREWAIRVFASLVEGWLGQGVPVQAIIGSQVMPLASGATQLQGIMDALARIDNAVQPPIEAALAMPACVHFTTGVQVIVTTDLGMKSIAGQDRHRPDRRWAVLRAEAFEGSQLPAARPSPRELGFGSIRPSGFLLCWATNGRRRFMGLETPGRDSLPVHPEVGPSFRVRVATFVLMASATYTIEVASLAPGEKMTRALLWATGYVLFAGFLFALFTAARSRHATLPRPLLAALFALGMLPFLVESLVPKGTQEGHPLEVQCLAAMRNFGLGLAVLGGWNVCLRMTCVIGLFLTLFAVSIADSWHVLPFLGLYSVVGVVWLSVVYWSGLRNVLGTSDSATREHLPWGLIVAASFLVAGVLAVASVGPKKVATVLGEWLPFSGGTGEFDRRARGGVNDGDEETSGNNARSTGFASSDQFLDSPLPSLYDVISDMYGEPFKPTDLERVMSLNGITARELPKPPADNLRPSREFSTVRKPPNHQRDPSSRSARALFEIEGPTPLHVRLAAFDFFDGQQWHEAALARRIVIFKQADSNWMRYLDGPGESSGGSVEHKFKIAKLNGKLVPTPPYLQRFRVGRLDDAGLFSVGQQGIMRMTHRNVPGGSIVETKSSTFDPHRLREFSMTNLSHLAGSEYIQLPQGEERIADLAQKWTKDIPSGWGQIEAVVNRLRWDYELDWNACPPPGCQEPTSWFLFESKCGPDYQFATAAALMLRHLGYPTRVVTGYYAGAEAFDSESKHTPVVDDDIHFWPEVLIPNRQWIVVEPTPGYEVMERMLPWDERLSLWLQRLGSWYRRHVLAVGFSLSALLGLYPGAQAHSRYLRLDRLENPTGQEFARLGAGRSANPGAALSLGRPASAHWPVCAPLARSGT